SVVAVEHPERGTFLTVGNPIKLSESPTEVKTSPLLGEHTEEILREIVGYGDDEIEAARSEGAI
ncbi:MAG: formyl-CoA transferase, partial [Alphaproteobacteria bacterium]